MRYSDGEIRKIRERLCFSKEQESVIRTAVIQKGFKDSETNGERIEWTLQYAKKEVDPEKYLHPEQIQRIVGVSRRYTSMAIQDARKLAIQKGICVTNRRGVGYKIADEKNAIDEASKSGQRAAAHTVSMNKIITQSIYDFEKLKDMSPQHYHLYLTVKGFSKHLMAQIEAHNELISECTKEVRLLEQKAREETERPEFDS